MGYAINLETTHLKLMCGKQEKWTSIRMWATLTKLNCNTTWLGESTSTTAGLVGCSWCAVISTYQRWSKEGQTKKVAWSDKSHFLLHHVSGQVCRLPGEEMAPRCIIGAQFMKASPHNLQDLRDILYHWCLGDRYQKTCGIHASMGQSCFGRIRGT